MFKFYKLATLVLFLLVICANVYVFLFWNEQKYVPPDTWEAIHFLQKNAFMNLQPGDVARIMYKGELIDIKGIKLFHKRGNLEMKKAIMVSFQKAYLNEPIREVKIVFGVLEQADQEKRFPMLTMTTHDKGSI